ncbi:MAG TPA: aspartate 1-decarboxylase [Candidatus Limnocylindrales bacterium]|nr:aspartate 1-decarboxylase [Candidatus Limnocylindrales bacterium]
MRLSVFKSKIHRAHVTEANLNYEGSVTLDADLMDAADILPHEQVQVLNVNNGERFDTYAIRGPRGSGVVCLNGPAARLAQVGDMVIILTYAWMEREELERHTPRVVMVDERNRPLRTEAAGGRGGSR